MDEDAVFEVGAHRVREGDPLHVAALANQVFDGVAVRGPDHRLLDDRSFVELVRSRYAGAISSIRHQFQLMKPESLRRVRGEIDGEDYDLQAVIDSTIDVIVEAENAGTDSVLISTSYTLGAHIENLTLTSATDERYARGGGTEFDYNLTLSDAIVGAGQTLTVSGALLMATETMVLDGSLETNGILRLFGGQAADTLKGGALGDHIHGNMGADTLRGGGGADLFRYDSNAESNSVTMDQILDFTPGTDKIDLGRIDAKTNVAGDQGFTWIGSGGFSGVAGQLRAFESGGTWFVQGDTNGDSVADLVVALTLQGPTPLGAGDFVL